MIIKRQQFTLQDKVVLGRIIFTPPFKVSASLENEARFVNIVHGKTKLHAPQNQYDLQTGDFFVMKCENFINNWFENENEEPSEAIIFQLYPEVLKYVYNDKIPDFFTHTPKVKANPVEKFQSNKMMDHYIDSLRYFFENQTYITDEFIKVKIQELILILMSTDTTGHMQSILGGLFNTTENEFKEIIHSNLYQDLSIEDLAFFSGLSLSSFKRKFKAIFDTSPVQYIKTKRLERAQYLLKSTQDRISDIAYDCGFNDVGYFSKTFHAAFGSTPSVYRKSFLA